MFLFHVFDLFNSTPSISFRHANVRSSSPAREREKTTSSGYLVKFSTEILPMNSQTSAEMIIFNHHAQATGKQVSSMGWNEQNVWEADDYNRLPALRSDNVHQKLVRQDKVVMSACFYGILTPPMTDEFFANAKREDDKDGIFWRYVLDKTPSGIELSIACRIGVGENVPVDLDVMVLRNDEAIYMLRYEWAYRNEYVSKEVLDYIERECPDIPKGRWDRAVHTYLCYRLGSDRGMKEDLVPITWADVKPRYAEAISRAIYEEALKDLMGRNKEITNGTAAIRLDEYNMSKMLDKAKAIKARYGSDKVVTWENPNDVNDKMYASYTGDKYYERVKKMCDVAYQLMEGDIVPRLFEKLPLKKDGTFKQEQTIIVFDGKISDIETYDGYVSGSKMFLGITTGDDFYSEYDSKGSIAVAARTARLAIMTMKTTRKFYPLLNEELEVQDIKTKTKYLKQADVKPGSVYAEKSGTKYLYVGVADHRRGCCPSSNDYHLYVRYTKKIEQAVKGCESLEELQDVLEEIELNWSCRENPRKFVSLVEKIVPEEDE